jgi:ribonuclease inhibitor
MIVEIDGSQVCSEADFHRVMVEGLNLPAHYGRNLDALWDVLSTDIERPVRIVWINSRISEDEMSADFAKIVELLRNVELQDVAWNLPEAERFKFELR